ncbi:acetoacetate--CoA ligase [Rhizobium sp. KVB221]|uniref:Acetoacetate--CoA ligase n=1 Tax=Rhizobium setariae TaxID=2801340 RepID=A0A936YUA7_9HYPH|nr:acetoacetate--CoA ligase [Rhizobium setariae]MBL0375221.1 acetoacetate--CoA ligase [Rhizobium setariae]
MPAEQPLWSPSAARVRASAMSDFMTAAAKATGKTLANYQELHAWSVDDREAFWSLVWDYCGLRGERGRVVLADGERMPGASFFPEARLNFTENLLWKTGGTDAIVFRGEDKVERHLTWDELRALVSRLQQAFSNAGLQPGDRVAAMLPNVPEAIACMLAAASLGAIWSSCSPDFGKQGVLDRFAQIAPKLFIACDGYHYNGNTFEVGDKVAAIAAELKPQQTIVVRYIGDADAVAGSIANAISLDSLIAPIAVAPLRFEPLPFDHPLYILFSSGTTGVPKCIVHSAGGTLIQHVKEHRLHADIRDGDKLFYFTTLSWMMWNWLATALASGATLVLYDGSPAYPDANVLFDYADAEQITHFGTSAKFIDGLRKTGLRPIDTHRLSSVRTIFSTGSPLSPLSFDYVYEAVKNDVHLASISGGTDIVSGFVVGVPILPVWSGEIQGSGLGMAMDVWSDDGAPVVGDKGELVCTKPFPCMPVMFWNDPDGTKYHEAYFGKFDNVWCHGDFAEWTEHGGMVIYGRSDTTLNPGGVRIGTAEIYGQVEQMSEIVEAVCIGQIWDNDVRTVLFVRLAKDVTLDDRLRNRIRLKIRDNLSPRHVPARVVAVADIPRTKSGKISELAVRNIVHGLAVKNQDALANPEALKLFEGLAELSA